MAKLSGVEVEQECFQAMERICKRTARAAVFNLKQDFEVIGVETLIEDADLNVQLKDSHPTAEERTRKVLKKLSDTLKEAAEERGGKNEPRYIFTNFVCEKKGRTIDKMVFIHFNPSACGVKAKMIYASSKGALKQAPTISFVDLHLTDYDEFDFEDLKPQVIFKSTSA